VLIKQLLRVHGSLFRSRSDTRFQDCHSLQVIATAEVCFLAVKRALELIEQQSFLGLLPWATTNKTR
jgi:hypothetical protein